MVIVFLSRIAFYFDHFYKTGTHRVWDITHLEKKNELNFDYIILLSLKRKNEMCSIELDSFTWKALKDENLESSTVLK